MSLNAQVLGSTSAGNSTIIWDSDLTIMIDCGFSRSHITGLFANLPDLPPIAGLLITHSHVDHAGGSMIKHLTKNGTTLYCHELARKTLTRRYESFFLARSQQRLSTFNAAPFSIGNFTICSFEVPHDSSGGCCGFKITHKNECRIRKITMATDVAFVDETCTDHFLDSDLLIVESNHDQTMLEQSGRPQWLIDRIKKAHLSNTQCAQLLTTIAQRSRVKPAAIFLTHLSPECNTHERALNCNRSQLDAAGHHGIPLFLTFATQPSERITL